MANTLAGMRIERAFVVHGEPGWDEPTPIGPFTLFDVRPGKVEHSMRDASHFGLPPCRAEELAGGDAEFNAAAIRAVFGQRDRGAHRSALLLGAALVLELTGREPDTRKGVEYAESVIDSGRAEALLEKLAAFEVSPR
jgi:anthranilate phosphoribosyltransferase